MVWQKLFRYLPLTTVILICGASSSTESLLGPTYAPELQRLVPFGRSYLEKLSLRHQTDLLSALKHPDLLNDLTRANVDLDGLRSGIVDSDAGKLNFYFEKAILVPSESSNEFLDFLRGLAPKTPAGKALREFLDDAGFAGKSLLNSELRNSDLRHVLTKHPLLRTFLHELPGIMDAMGDLNSGRISSDQFKKRVGANLFHNDGPGSQYPRGFWQSVLTKKLVANLVSSDTDPRVKSFFEFTVFSGSTERGVVLPSYSTPVTAEGVFHAVIDRVSQGSRGGIIKIFIEKGVTLKNAAEVLRDDPEGTVVQLEAFLEALQNSIYLTRNQKAAARNAIQRFLIRLRRQNEFLRRSVHMNVVGNAVESLVFQYRRNSIGSPVNLKIDASNKNLLERAIEDLLQAEEDLNGNPLFPGSKPPPDQGC